VASDFASCCDSAKSNSRLGTYDLLVASFRPLCCKYYSNDPSSQAGIGRTTDELEKWESDVKGKVRTANMIQKDGIYGGWSTCDESIERTSPS
jgi:hypothetical protein